MKGQHREVGAMRKAANGYWYTKTPQGWRLMHHTIMELRLGRSLKPGERVHFKDGNKEDYSIDNLELIPPKRTTLKRIEYKITEMERQLSNLKSDLHAEIQRFNKGLSESKEGNDST